MDKTDNTPDPYTPVWPAAAAADLPRREPGGTFAPGQAQVTWNPGHPQPGDTPDLRVPDPWEYETAERHGRVRYPLPPRRPAPPYNSLDRPVHPESYPPPPGPPGARVADPNGGSRFLRMSGGVLALSIAAAVLILCVLPIVACFGMGVIGAVTPSPSPSF